MYVWLWRHLPGPTVAKLGQALFLFAAMSALLLFVVFPWLHPDLWFNNVTVDGQ